MSGTVEVPELKIIHVRDTKRFALYVEEGNDMNKLYLPKGLPKHITYTPTQVAA